MCNTVNIQNQDLFNMVLPFVKCKNLCNCPTVGELIHMKDTLSEGHLSLHISAVLLSVKGEDTESSI